MTPEEYEKLDRRCVVRHQGFEAMFATPNGATKRRVETLFDQEPDTIAWIEGFGDGAVRADVGANIGMYTLWAARTRRARVDAFEPEALDNALLDRDIYASGLGAQVRAYCLALSDRPGPGELHLSQFMAGGSCHSLDEAVDPFHRPAQPVFTQGCVAATLPGPSVRSLLVEVNRNLPDHLEMVRELAAMGYRFDPEQVRRAERTQGPFRGCAEYVFQR